MLAARNSFGASSESSVGMNNKEGIHLYRIPPIPIATDSANTGSSRFGEYSGSESGGEKVELSFLRAAMGYSNGVFDRALLTLKPQTIYTVVLIDMKHRILVRECILLCDCYYGLLIPRFK